jgi:hypothetical protein
MLLAALAVALVVAAQGGCLQNEAHDGVLTCSTVPGRACPMGYYCETSSNTCWHDGDLPDMAMPTYDFTLPPFPDFHRDMTSPRDGN